MTASSCRRWRERSGQSSVSCLFREPTHHRCALTESAAQMRPNGCTLFCVGTMECSRLLTGARSALRCLRLSQGGYKPIAQALQAACPFPLWVAVPEFVNDLPEPAQFGRKVEELVQEMTDAGMHANRTWMVAHSLGGVMAQQYVAGNKGVVDALVLYGATVLRKYRETDFGVVIWRAHNACLMPLLP